MSDKRYETIGYTSISLDIAPVQIGYAKNKRDFMSSHRHDGFVEFYYIVQGNLNHHINGEVIEVKGPALIFVGDGDVHHLVTSDAVTMYLVMIQNDTYEQMWQYLSPIEVEIRSEEVRQRPGTRLTARMALMLENHFRDYLAKKNRQEGLEELEARLIVARLASLILDDQEDGAWMDSMDKLKKTPKWFEDLCNHTIEERLFLEGVEALVEWSGKSNAYLGKCFRQYMDLTPSAYINLHRLEYAKELLAYSDMPVIDVCMESGFGNLSHFYHLFKSRCGTSPSKYRTHNRTDFMI